MKRCDGIFLLLNEFSFCFQICMAASFFPHYYKRIVPEDYQQQICRELSGHDPFRTVIISGIPGGTNIIYDSQIRNLFKECSQNLVITYERSKLVLKSVFYLHLLGLLFKEYTKFILYI